MAPATQPGLKGLGHDPQGTRRQHPRTSNTWQRGGVFGLGLWGPKLASRGSGYVHGHSVYQAARASSGSRETPGQGPLVRWALSPKLPQFRYAPSLLVK